MDRRLFNKSLLATGGSLIVPTALAQDAGNWPSQSVKIIVPFAAGGTADALPRLIAEVLTNVWKQPVVIENRTGAGGNVGAETVAHADPDGYTLMASPAPPIAINQNLYPKLNFDPGKFKPITIIGSATNVVDVSNKLGVSTIAELIAKAKANPGQLNCANQGNGSTSHLTAALFESRAGVKFNHVPYRGTAPALNDLVAGHVDVFFDNISLSLPQHRGGTIKIIGVCSLERSPQLPDVPTLSESGLKDFSAIAWFAFMAPPGTPDAIIAKANRDIVAVIRSPDIQKKFLDQGAQPIGNSPSEAAAFIASEEKLWGGVIKQANVKLGE
ncbi:tripartite tricarboxylate transporter substrate binding protein [Roseiarcaceae bacterium H3SJ34-1]|uniref:Bug family tripartite tricarboxylate transporter substrate binding protein n=1 Tax=Terripilifer ovatus TaxID=3032367 RepID=UPI003AB9BB12|nr:tripartite tricarboxylate transporter substrate binding protein [Roseiarcaceae bacterium H3SJ34-1]